MIYIDLNKLSPSKEWLNKSQELLTELITHRDNKVERDRIIDKTSSQKHWKKLKNKLKKLSYGKCWFSEARDVYSYYHVDHFRPKKRAIDDTTGVKVPRDGYWWFTFDYKNYRLVGGVGNTIKVDHFAVKTNCATCPEDNYEDEIIYLLDPTKKNDPKKLIVDEEGTIKPLNNDETHWDNIRAKYTIEKMNLNYPDLKGARHIKWNKCNKLIQEVDILDTEYQISPSAKREEKLENKLNEVRTLIAPCEELSATNRACLRSSRRPWALALLEEAIEVDSICAEYMTIGEEEIVED
ncbi:hypothetical protein ACH34F_03930 [Elizabethkingia anophelis]|uniref:hypothetical protein n=1 Tax=Elizabethkingia anophelis TaxID=1117645 RepID=UPI00378708EA